MHNPEMQHPVMYTIPSTSPLHEFPPSKEGQQNEPTEEDLAAAKEENVTIREDDDNSTIQEKSTDVGFLMLFISCVVIWLSLGVYCIYHGDLSRLKLKPTNQQNGFTFLACLFAALFSRLLLVLCCRFAKWVIWFVFVVVLAIISLFTAYMWIRYGDGGSFGSEEKKSRLVFAIIPTVLSFFFALRIFSMRKKIRLAVRLFKEASKAVQSMSLLLAQSFVTSVMLGIVICLFILFMYWIESSGIPQIKKNGNVEYQKNEIMKAASVCNFFVVWWIIQFIICCQHMVIAKATTIWYFSRDKTCIETESPIIIGYVHTLRYHLGSVALGSLILPPAQILRALYRAAKYVREGRACRCLLTCFCGLDKIMQNLSCVTRKAYTELAILGRGFITCGERSVQVSAKNAIKMSTINSVVDFVMNFCRFFVAVVAVLFGLQLKSLLRKIFSADDIALEMNFDQDFIFIPIISFVIAHAFMSAFEVIVESTFISFCENCERYNGVKSVFMSEDMMVFANEDTLQKLKAGGDTIP
ncbi:choline transporter-like protein 1 [Planococcus citri]|uniref:choline transporter-like protein 1 n=1 Tax=Planococcus citri TaxID=170843 RepID=UPI0031F7CA37